MLDTGFGMTLSCGMRGPALYYPVEILMWHEWPGSRVPTLPCPREISRDLFDASSGIAGRNKANFPTY